MTLHPGQGAVGAMSGVDAMYLAHRLHADQFDFDDAPHYDHLLRVSRMVPVEYHAVAFLHDVVEDTETTVADLVAQGLSHDEADAVGLLTRREDDTYAKYIRRIATAVGYPGVLARRVKEADLLDNLTRCLWMAERDEKAASLVARYRAHLPTIQQAMVGR